jgi:hypothetical protein
MVLIHNLPLLVQLVVEREEVVAFLQFLVAMGVWWWWRSWRSLFGKRIWKHSIPFAISGNNGGQGGPPASAYGGGGGGGAGGVGSDGTGAAGGNGGTGTSNSISGSSLNYAGGGGGGSYDPGTAGTGGSSVGGNGGVNADGSAGTTNRGGGGVVLLQATPRAGGNGGSGVVIIKIPDTKTATFTGGVTELTSTAGGYITYVVTATSTTNETVTFS